MCISLYSRLVSVAHVYAKSRDKSTPDISLPLSLINDSPLPPEVTSFMQKSAELRRQKRTIWQDIKLEIDGIARRWAKKEWTLELQKGKGIQN